MEIRELDLETRNKIYSHTKSILRKYQKGIVTGKLTADKFAQNLLCDDYINHILSEDLLNEEDFKSSYIEYINTLIDMQNENLATCRKRKKEKKKILPPNISQKVKLKNLLLDEGYDLIIPIQYLNGNDMDSIIKYIETGDIELGNERIYNYIRKTNLS
ncbi:hypothetical protein [Terrisporobacter mayombei]|uniref:Uncharacterized protein n=1 Tax=Terrisporobacter mayombei TaxID=1541 RepID=A0ABY9Q7L6_9FIRM|nr:hypothetical protein [Terrisporobacter mayombei]MCC3869560.1 hypothetical protein [Terrisporobacter mayombei]WMT83503.1 hypothetical protein TEMA_40210 [Terrisporobacter mayombei]